MLLKMDTPFGSYSILKINILFFKDDVISLEKGVGEGRVLYYWMHYHSKKDKVGIDFVFAKKWKFAMSKFCSLDSNVMNVR
jgi:hypothetical protein